VALQQVKQKKMTEEKILEVNIEGMIYNLVQRDDKRALFKVAKIAIYEYHDEPQLPGAYKRAYIAGYKNVYEESYIVYHIKKREKGGKIIESVLMPSDFGKCAWTFSDYSLAKKYYDFLENNSLEELIKISSKHIKHLETYIK
jgi:hypothetical protein